MLSALSSVRIAFRMVAPPFGSMSYVEGAPAAYLALLSGLIAAAASVVQAIRYREGAGASLPGMNQDELAFVRHDHGLKPF